MSETDGAGKSDISREDLLRPLAPRKIRHRLTQFLLPAGTKKNDKVVPAHYFTPKQLEFLTAYAATLDIQAACKKTGMTLYQVQKSPYLNEEIRYINEAVMLKHRSGLALGRHERLLDKFEKEFDGTHDKKHKASMASTLARMSEASMKASGEFQERRENSGLLGVQVNINIALPEPAESGPVIDVQAGPADA